MWVRLWVAPLNPSAPPGIRTLNLRIKSAFRAPPGSGRDRECPVFTGFVADVYRRLPARTAFHLWGECGSPPLTRPYSGSVADEPAESAAPFVGQPIVGRSLFAAGQDAAPLTYGALSAFYEKVKAEGRKPRRLEPVHPRTLEACRRDTGIEHPTERDFLDWLFDRQKPAPPIVSFEYAEGMEVTVGDRVTVRRNGAAVSEVVVGAIAEDGTLTLDALRFPSPVPPLPGSPPCPL